MHHLGDRDTSSKWRTRNNSQKFGKDTGRLRNQRTRRDHPDSRIIKINQDTEN